MCLDLSFLVKWFCVFSTLLQYLLVTDLLNHTTDLSIEKYQHLFVCKSFIES